MIDKYKHDYKKQFKSNSSFKPLGNSVFKAWIQNASLWRSNLSLSPPLFIGLTTSI